MSRRAFIFINGILTDPRRPDAWTDEAVDWVNRKLPDGCVGTSYEYNATPLLRRLGQQARAADVARRANGYRRSGYRVHLVGHSNGCDLIAKVIGGMSTDVESVHLFAPAADEADFEQAIEYGAVQKIHIYGSRRDRALGIGARLSRVLTFGMLGYGSLGLRGREFAAANPAVVRDHSRDDFGHSDWFQPRQNFVESMKLLAANESLPIISQPLQPIAP